MSTRARASLGPRYDVLRELGSGGVGRVVLVLDRHLGRELALKLLHDAPSSRADLESFQREFELLSKIEHPAVARAHDFGCIDELPYFTCEFVPGPTLASLTRIVDPARIARIALDLTGALAFLHRNGILHLDVKPSNVIVPAEASRPGAVLVDFGIFRRGGATFQGGKVQGSLPYMGPERFQEVKLQPSTDVYALGVTFYRVLTGAFPRAGATDGDPRLTNESAWRPLPPAPSELGSRASALDGWILKCLALDPAARYASAVEALEDLERACEVHGLSSRATAPAATIVRLVGREEELRQGERFLERVGQRAASPVLLLTGPPGAGQTALLRELKVVAQTRKVRFYLETGYPGGGGSPGGLFRALGTHLGPEGSARRLRWESFLENLARPRRSGPHEAFEAERRQRRAAELIQAARGLTEPVVIAADGLQLFDEVSVGLFCDLARFLSERNPGEGLPLGLIAGCREEGPSRAIVRELSSLVVEAGRGDSITLLPLRLPEAIKLYASSAHGVTKATPLELYEKTGGLPSAILFAAGRSSEAFPAAPRRYAGPSGTPSAGRLDADERLILWTLVLLGRPATIDELRRLLGPRKRIDARLAALEAAGLVSAAESGKWTASSGAVARLASEDPRRSRRRLHLAIARKLVASGEGDATCVEAARHLIAAGAARELVPIARRAVRYLQRTCQNRAALELCRVLHDALPRRNASTRLELALEMADLHGRVGSIDEGIRLLAKTLPDARATSTEQHARVLLRLATLHGRRGDYRRAEALFQQGLDRRRRTSGLARLEHLFFLNERASLQVIVGKPETALSLCAEGLRLAAKEHDPRSRELALNLLATRANVHLRAHEYEKAIESFESSLEIAEAMGSQVNQAAILNNLGIVYNQCDRYAEAVAAFEEAEKTCVLLDEGPSLVSIHCNLAVIHAKLGDFAAAEERLAAAERLSPQAMGRRQEFFLAHSRGLVQLSAGRFASARESFDGALRLAEALGDAHVASFDDLYRCEALTFEGRYEEAERGLERLSKHAVAPRVRAMARARLDFLQAITGRSAEGGARGPQDTLPARSIPYLDAWDSLYTAWAGSLRLEGAGVLRALEPAERFFAAHGLRPGLVLARWIASECRLVGGVPPEVEGCRADAQPAELEPANDLTAVLVPLLRAREALGGPTLPLHRSRAADLLAGAAAALGANPLPEWSARLEALRAAVSSDPARRIAAANEIRRRLAANLPEEARARYLTSAHWQAWSRVECASPLPELEEEASAGEATAVLASCGNGNFRSRLVALSRPMRRVVELLERLRGAEGPVLIQGETGAGKELIARILHEESSRRDHVLYVVDCATLPGDLLEAELFGARAGSFTGIEQDRPGILAAAEGGTVLIDEIAGTPLAAQAKLLRVLSEGMFRPLGAELERAANVRFLFSTASDLEEEARAGRFRRDLLFRVRGVVLDVPPLRERPEDLPELVERILGEAHELPPRLETGALQLLQERPWPGNVRELRNVLARLTVRNQRAITAQSLRDDESEPKTSTIFPRNLLARDSFVSLRDQLERDYLVHHLRRLGGNTAALCKFLGVGRRQLYRRCSRLGIALRDAIGPSGGA